MENRSSKLKYCDPSRRILFMAFSVCFLFLLLRASDSEHDAVREDRRFVAAHTYNGSGGEVSCRGRRRRRNRPSVVLLQPWIRIEAPQQDEIQPYVQAEDSAVVRSTAPHARCCAAAKLTAAAATLTAVSVRRRAWATQRDGFGAGCDLVEVYRLPHPVAGHD